MNTIKTPQEYREKIASDIKEIKLPSGLICKIRPVPTLKILELTQKAEDSKQELDQFMRQNFREALNTVVPSSVVSPTMLPAREAGDTSELDENALYLDELIIGDLNEIFLRIVEISGISAKENQEYQKFPEHGHGKNRSPNR